MHFCWPRLCSKNRQDGHAFPNDAPSQGTQSRENSKRTSCQIDRVLWLLTVGTSSGLDCRLGQLGFHDAGIQLCRRHAVKVSSRPRDPRAKVEPASCQRAAVNSPYFARACLLLAGNSAKNSLPVGRNPARASTTRTACRSKWSACCPFPARAAVASQDHVCQDDRLLNNLYGST